MKTTVTKITFKNIDERFGGQEHVSGLDEYESLAPDSSFEMTRDEIIEHTPEGESIVVAEKVILSVEQHDRHPVSDIVNNIKKSLNWTVEK